MKELSIEQKARAYDEALEKAKDFYKGYKQRDNQLYADDLETIFPELKESEDEKIRKSIIGYLKECRNNTRSEVMLDEYAKWISWLEKQGEQKSTDKIEPKFKVGDTVTVKPMSCHGKVFKGEPFKIVDIIEDNYVSDDGKTYSISLQDGWELVQQKPAEWSEEDERTYRGLHNLIYSTPYCNSRKKLSDFLKSLKDRVQPKQEWAEEDEKCIRLSIDIIDSALRAGFCVQLDRDRCIDWLKSIKQRYTWKPSEEQITWLYRAADDASKDSRMKQILNELLSDLKKLKGE